MGANVQSLNSMPSAQAEMKCLARRRGREKEVILFPWAYRKQELL